MCFGDEKKRATEAKVADEALLFCHRRRSCLSSRQAVGGAPAIEHCGRIPERSKVRELDVIELRCNPFLLDLLWELRTLSFSLSLRERERRREILCEASNRECWERNYCNEFLLHESFRLIYIDPRARERKAVLRSISSSWESEIDLSPRERQIRHR